MMADDEKPFQVPPEGFHFPQCFKDFMKDNKIDPLVYSCKLPRYVRVNPTRRPAGGLDEAVKQVSVRGSRAGGNSCAQLGTLRATILPDVFERDDAAAAPLASTAVYREGKVRYSGS